MSEKQRPWAEMDREEIRQEVMDQAYSWRPSEDPRLRGETIRFVDEILEDEEQNGSSEKEIP